MALTPDAVRERLQSTKGPGVVDLVASGKPADVVVTDGKVFFSLTVDAAEAKAWEEVRKSAEAAIRAIPGVASVLVALTAERRGGAQSPVRPQPPPGAAAARGGDGPAPG